MNHLSIKEKILANIAFNQMVPMSAIMSLHPSERYIYRELQKLEADNLVKVKKLKIRKGNRYWRETFYLISMSGAELLSKCKQLWSTEIPVDILKKASTYGGEHNPYARLRKRAQIAEAKLMSTAAGAITDIFFSQISREEIQEFHKLVNGDDEELTLEEISGLDELEGLEASEAGSTPEDDDIVEIDLDDDSESNPISDSTEDEPSEEGSKTYVNVFREYLVEDLRQDQIELSRSVNSGEELRFFGTSQVKMKVLSNISGDIYVRDYDKCMFNGIVESQFKSVLMYSSYTIGFGWKMWNVRQDLRVADLWCRSYSICKSFRPSLQFETHDGCFLFKNVRQFIDYYSDAAKVRRDGTVLGQGFKHFYGVPRNHTGVCHLNFILTNPEEIWNEKVKNRLAMTDGMIAEKNWHPNTFELLANDGWNETYFMIGTHLDVRKIQLAKKIADVNDNRRFGVICFQWQEEYYKRLFPEWKIKIISMDEN